MDTQTYEIPSWVPQIERGHVSDQGIIIAESEGDSGNHTDYLVHEVPSNIDQIAAENLIFMARDGQMEIIDGESEVHGANDDSGIVNFHDDYAETQMVTEEVITDDWVQHQGEERVEIPAEQICGSLSHVTAQDNEVPLPTVQDEYTALRPYPCDFCSRRFRKKVSLMNHMVAHQNDRPHVCKLCGSRFFRRNDLINHLKAHAESSEFDENEFFETERQSPPPSDHYYDQEWQTEIKSIKKPRGKRTPKGTFKEENYTIDETLRQRHHTPQIHEESINHQQPQEQEQEQGQEHEQFYQEVTPVMEDIKNVQRFPVIDENKPFVCQQCGLSFAREKALSSHVKAHRNDSTFECGTCNEMFWDANTLQEHQKSHQFEASNSEYEPDVDNESDSESEYKYGDFYCSQCGMSFHRQDLLRRHSKSHIKKEVIDKDQHCCNTCGETFVEALDLLAHAEIHARYPPFKCVLCGESFFEECTIKRHLTNLHSAEMTTNSCILCGKECRDRKALMKHAWDHSREKCHSCSKCGKNFHNKARLKRHMASHRDKSVVCNVCQEEFPDGRSLSNHRHSHSVNASGKLFPCNECGKTFGSRSSQQIHVRIHTGERPYGCRYCWKAFADGGTLRKHERIHTGEKPYACSVCPRAFNQRVVLREHIRSHHSGLDSKRQTFYCSVCCSDLPSSTELIQHLIQHSDINTAMQRQPVTGPRKYKRRRKLKPHEIDRMRSENKNSSDIDISDFDMDNVDDLLGIPNQTSPTNKSNRAQTLAEQTSSTAVLLGSTESDSKKQRYNSTGSSEKYTSNWHTKLINSSTEDTYKSLLSNLENTLQSIDTLVVSNPSSYGNTASAEVPPPTPTPTSTAVSLPKTPKTSRRKNASASKASGRPKMIHTEKTRLPIENGKRKTKTFVTRTEPSELDMFSQRSKCSSSHANDYEIISPDKYPPNQIQSSPVHIKQEIVCSRSELYDAQLLLEATSARRELDKYNPAIVNDLEEILRSPDKSKSPRRRTISDRTDDEIKAEPHSPIQQNFEFVRRSTRPRRPVVNRKYLAYETDLPSPSSKARSRAEKRETKSFISAPAPALKSSPIPSPPSPPTPPPVRKQHYFECEMCSSVFPDRAQLLDHVPIHI